MEGKKWTIRQASCWIWSWTYWIQNFWRSGDECNSIIDPVNPFLSFHTHEYASWNHVILVCMVNSKSLPQLLPWEASNVSTPIIDMENEVHLEFVQWINWHLLDPCTSSCLSSHLSAIRVNSSKPTVQFLSPIGAVTENQAYDLHGIKTNNKHSWVLQHHPLSLYKHTPFPNWSLLVTLHALYADNFFLMIQICWFNTWAMCVFAESPLFK